MIPQLVQTILSTTAVNPNTPTPAEIAAASQQVLQADPADLAMYMEHTWASAQLVAPLIAPPTGIRSFLLNNSALVQGFPIVQPQGTRVWDHFGYSFCIENTRAAQIMLRVVQAFRSGEALGIPTEDTQRWLETTEMLLFGAVNPIAAWMSTSGARPSAEAVRRNAYWRMFAMDLSFGTESNSPFVYDKAEAANRSFPRLFEELLFELWKAFENINNQIGPNAADNDRIFRLAQQLGDMLRVRRLREVLNREELAAATAMGWLDLTLAMDTPVVVDLRAQATSPGDRLRIIGERVGLAPHSKASAFFAMAAELSVLLRFLEAGTVTDSTMAPMLYDPTQAANISVQSRRVLTEWSVATGRDLKAGKAAVPVQQQRALASR